MRDISLLNLSLPLLSLSPFRFSLPNRKHTIDSSPAQPSSQPPSSPARFFSLSSSTLFHHGKVSPPASDAPIVSLISDSSCSVA
ncbi:hypothetical protein TIFTF001_042513 [Ficus carica]|uniref:Uncharacterized protein n=1 Tax=Ficus carica TaxID=3494 RepID=A0AA87ZH61_FICCA|nr:hypothetical protein TIFTF001_042513 [Ficus carica]